ncbi:MAG: helix-turn-helix domain-containing protein [Alphaproteobacteria bacterium]|nr:helix-turn-helix domain-containing protein [Alphaproteobacteria bacterium]MBU1514043.1 helix-turn-helix domain-containing protein [Alphaproteobacteria bacterium]MBU2093017.1 helix-turn-helix domain-containing protein [Alphaproteobacteria bacterium]MBU2151780.1 helix-turn-helix domain-containing protein [Alphaproteobacteria bacterium]MBU2309400.1 helix-turn-helix domain-containing protein [Alphaproteobacteria bacterium]
MSTAGQEPPRVSVRVYYPHPDLQSYVTFYYVVEAAGPLTDFLYPEWGNVRLNLAGDWMVLNDPRDPPVPAQRVLYGPTDRRGKIVTGGGKTAGFGLTPGGWARLIGSDASKLANRVVEISDQIDLDVGSLQAALVADGDDDAAGVARFDRVLLDLLARRPPTPPAVLAVDHALRNQPRDVPTFAAMAGISPRSLHRLCLRAYGFPPKRLLRRQRFLYTLGLIRVTPDPTLSRLIDLEYHDQSHFNRDFHDFMGMTARDYAATPRALMQAAAAAQVAIGIPLSFRLPEPPEA